MSVVIKIEDISKQYRLGTVGTGTLSHDLNRWWAMMRGKTDPYLKLSEVNRKEQKGVSDYVWALKDINAEVSQGEVLGVIGRNGAGKSTLLKIMSQITGPTTGQVKIKGRIASLLEVGTGFHHELTGRENVFLNGAVLGMGKKEITRKFDEIVDFSGVERYIDTPVKRYSSGMIVRLGFAVAAHLEPEILLIDEVLAVGDLAFQKKCLGKMKDVSSEGRTVLFVSHNMQGVRSLCTRAIYLSEGEMKMEGNVDDVVDQYTADSFSMELDAETSINNEDYRRGNGACRYSSIRMLNINGEDKNIFNMGESIKFEFELKILEDIQSLSSNLAIRAGGSHELLTSIRNQLPFTSLEKGSTHKFSVLLENHRLRPGEYPLFFTLNGNESGKSVNYDTVDDVLAPLVIKSDLGINEPGYDPDVYKGYFSIDSKLELGN